MLMNKKDKKGRQKQWKEDLDNAYQTLQYLENKYVNNLDELIKFTNYLSAKFKSKNRV